MMSMLMLRPTADQIARAKAREADMEAKLIEKYGKEHLDNSISEGEGTLIGLLGEEISYDLYYPMFTRSTGRNIYDYDLAAPNSVGTVDVKTKSCKSSPQPHYWCTVCAANIKQRCDYYLFMRIMEDHSLAWVLGFLPKPLFFDAAVQFSKGDLDPTSHCGWTFKWDCFNVPVSQLWAPPRDPEIFTLQKKLWTPKRYAFST